MKVEEVTWNTASKTSILPPPEPAGRGFSRPAKPEMQADEVVEDIVVVKVINVESVSRGGDVV